MPQLPKEDFQTQLSVAECSSNSPPLRIPSPTYHQATTLSDIMAMIEQESIALKQSHPTAQTPCNGIRSRKWSQQQTRKFYDLLGLLGPDFTCMSSHQLFAGVRCKKELKNKFRKEQRLKGREIDLCLQGFYLRGRTPR